MRCLANIDAKVLWKVPTCINHTFLESLIISLCNEPVKTFVLITRNVSSIFSDVVCCYFWGFKFLLSFHNS